MRSLFGNVVFATTLVGLVGCSSSNGVTPEGDAGSSSSFGSGNTRSSAHTWEAPQNIVLQWNTNSKSTLGTNELYEAFRQTFAPNLASDADCVAAGDCVIANNYAYDGILVFAPLGFNVFFESTVGTPA